ncbi:hypothetical protein IRZ83_13300 [Flavobacterium sp. JLP]|uniref:hypothetical protein n=1 Tax=unclassified Flavobacterium TaxID=196869 RepID=UPI000AA4E64C|nr:MULTISPECIES: hypothetical protein [unclassified Flavobacterium]MBF4494252.1 hypothetical protein [Flavobacterium sp. MR2016-29]MBF4507646.1 hypothetical protein [Flavobacterium sp. JLP]
MEPSWIILTFTGIIVLIMMIYIFRQNKKDRKAYEDDLNKPSNFYEDQSEVNDVQ